MRMVWWKDWLADWVFVDWADGYLDKKGELSFEQILLCKSLETMALCARLLDQQDDRDRYSGMATSLRAKLEPFFWDDTRKAMVHNRIDGIQSKSVTRYSNMFLLFSGIRMPGSRKTLNRMYCSMTLY